jgi:hypothetical protein
LWLSLFFIRVVFPSSILCLMCMFLLILHYLVVTFITAPGHHGRTRDRWPPHEDMTRDRCGCSCWFFVILLATTLVGSSLFAWRGNISQLPYFCWETSSFQKMYTKIMNIGYVICCEPAKFCVKIWPYATCAKKRRHKWIVSCTIYTSFVLFV